MIAIGELVQNQIQIFLIVVLWGMILFLLYDCFRIARRIVIHKLWAIAIEDILYWVVWTYVVFYLLNQIDKGIIRGFTLGGIFLGMMLYYFLVSKWVIRIAVWILRKVIYIMKVILHFVAIPIRAVYKLLRPSSRYIKNKATKMLRTNKKRLQNQLHTIKMGLCKL